MSDDKLAEIKALRAASAQGSAAERRNELFAPALPSRRRPSLKRRVASALAQARRAHVVADGHAA